MFEVNAQRVRQLAFERGLSLNELAQQARLNAVTARKALQDGSKLTAKVISALSKLFGVDGNELVLR